jgi:hypothetical protein
MNYNLVCLPFTYPSLISHLVNALIPTAFRFLGKRCSLLIPSMKFNTTSYYGLWLVSITLVIMSIRLSRQSDICYRRAIATLNSSSLLHKEAIFFTSSICSIRILHHLLIVRFLVVRSGVTSVSSDIPWSMRTGHYNVRRNWNQIIWWFESDILWSPVGTDAGCSFILSGE